MTTVYYILGIIIGILVGITFMEFLKSRKIFASMAVSYDESKPNERPTIYVEIEDKEKFFKALKSSKTVSFSVHKIFYDSEKPI